MSSNVNVFELPQASDFTTDEETTQARGATREATAEKAFMPLTIHRDPADVRTILSLAVASICLVVLVLLMASLLVYQLVSAPALVVVDRTKDGDRVVSMNGQAITGGVSYATDRPSDEDKKSAAKVFTTSLYQIDPDPKLRSAEVAKALRMMTPEAAKALVELMKQKRELERQRAESWQTVWNTQVNAVDKDDPYKVNVVGTQEITRVAGGALKQERRQLMFTLKLIADPQKRDERNQYTGFLVANILDFQEITEPTPAAQTGQASLPAAESR